MKIIDRQLEDRIRRHLATADIHMRDLFGYLWHRRNEGIGKTKIDNLARDIKRGERLLKEFNERF